MGLPNTTHRLLSKQLCAFTNPGALAWCEIGLACLGVAREGSFYPPPPFGASTIARP